MRPVLREFFLKYNMPAVYLVLYLAVAVLLSVFPLLNDLDYEYHVLMSIAGSWLAGMAVLNGSAVKRQPADTTAEVLPVFFSGNFIIPGAMILFGFLIECIICFTGPACCRMRFAVLFILFQGPGILFGFAVALMFIQQLRRFRKTAFTLLWPFSLLYNLYQIYALPPVSGYSLFWGYFAGPVYDEWIPVTWPFVAGRVWLIIWIIFLLWLTLYPKFKIYHRRSFCWLTAGVVVYNLFNYLLVDNSYAALHADMRRFKVHEHITVWTTPDVPETEVRPLFNKIRYDYESLSDYLHIASQPEITVYLYSDDEEKKHILGAGETNLAKLWRNEVHVNLADADAVLRHEMAHLLAGEFGNRLYGTLDVGLLEGLAVACEWPVRYLNPHQWSAVLEKKTQLPDIEKMIRGKLFFTAPGRLGYTVSGSFCRWLIDTYGIDKFKRLYAGFSYTDCYSRTVNQLIDEWRHFIRTVPVDSSDLQLTEWLLRPGVFQKRCVHVAADLLHEARKQAAFHNWEQSINYYAEALRLNPMNEVLRLEYARAVFYSGRYDETLRIISEPEYPESSYWAQGRRLMLMGDVLLMQNRPDSAAATYQRITATYASPGQFYESAVFRIEMIRLNEIHTLQNIISIPQDNINISLENIVCDKACESPLLRLARFFQTNKEPLRCIRLLETVQPFTDSILEMNRLNLLLECYIYLGYYEKTDTIIQSLTNRAVRHSDREWVLQKSHYLQWLKRQ